MSSLRGAQRRSNPVSAGSPRPLAGARDDGTGKADRAASLHHALSENPRQKEIPSPCHSTPPGSPVPPVYPPTPSPSPHPSSSSRRSARPPTPTTPPPPRPRP